MLASVKTAYFEPFEIGQKITPGIDLGVFVFAI